MAGNSYTNLAIGRNSLDGQANTIVAFRQEDRRSESSPGWMTSPLGSSMMTMTSCVKMAHVVSSLIKWSKKTEKEKSIMFVVLNCYYKSSKHVMLNNAKNCKYAWLEEEEEYLTSMAICVRVTKLRKGVDCRYSGSANYNERLVWGNETAN